MADAWLDAHEEDHTGPAASLNQYWYSAATITALIDVVQEEAISAHGKHPSMAQLDCAFVSTPSLFFALSPSQRTRCRVFDFDTLLGEGEPHFVHYDFNKPRDLPQELCGAFKLVVVDPPFITAEVWRQYSETVRLLRGEGGSIILTTVIENAPLLDSLLGVQPRRFLPSIPNLPYQYATYTNFDSPRLAMRNPEVPHDPDALIEAARCSSQSSRESKHVEADRPINGAGAAYDFDEMVRRAEQAEAAAMGAAGAATG